MTSSAPNILVIGSLESKIVSQQLTDSLHSLAKGVFAAGERLGVTMHFVESALGQADVAEALEGRDGLLVLGGADADPTCYGVTDVAQTSYGIDPEADRFELAVMKAAAQKGLPILGICRGMQLMNILHGGDLIQEVGEGTMHNSTDDNSDMTFHPVQIAPNSTLAEIYGAGELVIRSGHHQAVGRLGEGLTITARAPDGIVEAIEGAGWMVGVQWHPEDPDAPQEDFDKLLKGFVAAAAKH